VHAPVNLACTVQSLTWTRLWLPVTLPLPMQTFREKVQSCYLAFEKSRGGRGRCRLTGSVGLVLEMWMLTRLTPAS
jgi:hypothetical protein